MGNLYYKVKISWYVYSPIFSYEIGVEHESLVFMAREPKNILSYLTNDKTTGWREEKKDGFLYFINDKIKKTGEKIESDGLGRDRFWRVDIYPLEIIEV